MDLNCKEYNTKNVGERKFLVTESSSVKDQSPSFITDCPASSSALKDLNVLTKEKLSALENAQRKWLEDMRHSSTTDDTQKAQLQWIQKFSAFPTFSTINSPEKNKGSPWPLPFSPPRSSSDISHRRGYCVYEPGIKDNCNRKVAENMNDIKIAQLPEPPKVPLGNSVTSIKPTLSTPFSPFSESRFCKLDRSSQKRHITIRKKLQCQKKLDLTEASKLQHIVEPEPVSKSAGNTPDKSEEERRAARKYIHRKRVERERQLREQKEQEEKAEQERRARMERLKETQHRILANSIKRPPKQQRKKEGWVGLAEKTQEDEHLSREMLEPPNYSGAHITGAIPFLSSRGKQSSSGKDSKSSPRAPSIVEFETEWTQDENVPPPMQLKWDSMPLDISEVKGTQLLSTRLSSPTKLSSSSGRPSSVSSIPEKLKELSLQKPSTPTLFASPSNSKSSSKEQSVTEVTTLASEVDLFSAKSLAQSHPVIHDSDQPEKLEDDELNKILSFSSQFSKNSSTSSAEKPTKLFDNNNPLFTTSSNLFSDCQYSMLAAISNKRLAYKELENESTRKQQKTYDGFETDSQPVMSNYNFAYDKINPEKKNVDDKGVQCEVDFDEVRYSSSTSDQLDSISNSSAMKLTQSERLRKPNIILLPGRLSDPYVYSRTKESNNEVRIDTTVSENLSIDPLNISGKLSWVPKKNVCSNNDVSRDQAVPEAFSKDDHSNFYVVPSGKQEEKNRSLELKMNSKSPIKVSQDFHDEKLSDATKSEISSAVLSQIKNNHIARKVEAEIKRLDLFEDCIRDALDKHCCGKNNRGPDDKLSFNENLDITSKNTNMSDISLAASRETSLAKSTSTKTSSDKISSQFDAKWNDVGVMNFAKFSLNMFIDLLKEENLRNRQQESHFKMRETSIIDKTKAEIAYLELEKKKFKLMGNEDGVRNIRKKIRGLIMKLQQNLEDLQLVKKMEKAAYRGRRRLLLEKIDLMKDQLQKQMESERKTKKEMKIDTSRSSIESSREPIFLETRERRMTVPVVPENTKRAGDTEERLSWKLKLEEGERRIQELEDLIKHSSFGKEVKIGKTVERGTSPLQLSSDEERKKGDGSYSDTFDQLSTSSQHEKLENKDARKMIALKVPLSPRVTLKRRHSSGSDESLLLSQAETQSDASDMETRVLALQQQLKQRKAELESLHKEYRKSQRERLIAKEQSLLSQIQAYDMYIGQVKKELDKEKDGTEVKIVKPVIKHPKLSCERRKSDTWLLQEKKCIQNSSRTINSCELVKNTENIDKNRMDDKFFDNKTIEKFTLKTDLVHEVGDCIQQPCEEQFVSAVVSNTEMVDSEEAKIQNERKIILESTHMDIKNYDDSTGQLETNSNVNKNGAASSVNYVSQGAEEESLQGTKIEEKIDFYEKLSETSYSSIETNSEAALSQKKTKNISSAKDLTSRQVLNSIEQKYYTIPLDSKDAEELSTLSLPVSKHPNEWMENESNYDSLTSAKEEKKSESLEKTGFIKINTGIGSCRTKDNITYEDSDIKEDVTSIILTEIEENSDVQEAHSSTLSQSHFKETDHIIKEENIIYEESIVKEEHNIDEVYSIKEEESIKEISELLSEVPGSLKSKEESVKEESSGLMTLSIANETSCDSVHNSKSRDISKLFIEPLDNKKELSENEIEEVEKSVQGSLSKKDISIEDAISSINSEELFSGASFPLPTFKNKTVETAHLKENSISEHSCEVDINDQQVESELAISEATLQDKRLSSVSEEISHAHYHSDDQPILDSEVENGLSDNVSMEKQLSSVAEEVDAAKSETEDIKTELSAKDHEIRSDVEESLKQLITEQLNSISSVYNSSQVKHSVSDEAEEVYDLDRSITESLVDASLAEEQEDSLDEDINRVLLENMGNKLIEHDDGCENGNSFMDDKEMYHLINDDKRGGGVGGAPLIDALQREGDSALDQVWRGIADAAVNDATDLVISTFFNKATGLQTTESNKSVGDSDDDELDGEELQRQQAAEAEILRLQQLRIDKEIEELEEEEARRYYYIRPIPDKPPPPYTPRRSSLVASVVEAAGEIWDGRTEAPPTFMAGCHLREFLWDLAAELVVRVRPPTPPPQPSWIHIRRRRPKRHIRTKEDLLSEVEKEAKIYLGVEERECRENLIIRWSRKRRDHVDEILVKESQEEEWEWTDYSEEENIIKNRIADAIIQESLSTATAAIAQAFINKFKE